MQITFKAHRPKLRALHGPYAIRVDGYVSTASEAVLSAHIVGTIETKREVYNQTEAAKNRLGVLGGVIGIEKYNDLQFVPGCIIIPCSSFEYVSFAIDQMGDVPAVSNGINYSATTQTLKLTLAYDGGYYADFNYGKKGSETDTISMKGLDPYP